MPNATFFTLGCKVNQYDTQALREHVLRAGFVDDPQSARDVCVINTCTVTHTADAQSFALIRKAARDNPRALIAVVGCLAQTDKARIQEEFPSACVIPANDRSRAAAILLDALSSGRRQGVTRPGVSAQQQGISYFEGRTRAFLKIQDGCDNRCSYCKVPLARGRSRSKPLEEVVREAARLSAHGYKEIVLCGVCLGSYGKDLKSRRSIVDVLRALAKVPGITRLRLSSIEALDVTPALLEHMAQERRVCRHLHVPLQSGDDDVLRRMRRKYTRRQFGALVERIRKMLPAAAVSTDILAGFPGETEEQFENTLALLKQIRPMRVHIFPYSERPGTPAARCAAQKVDPRIVQRRIRELRKAADACALAFRQLLAGKEALVLFEEQRAGVWIGHTDTYVTVAVRSKRNLRNVCCRVRLCAPTKQGMTGVLARKKVF